MLNKFMNGILMC